MPLLAALIEALFTALATFLLKLFAAKVAIRVAAVGAIAALGGVLMGTFNGLIAPLVQAAFDTQYGQVIGLAFPPVAGTCLAAYSTLWVACTTYKLQERAILATANI